MHQVSWLHPRSHHWHQLDLIITLNSVLTIRSNHSTDCDTDHSPVGCKVRLQPKKLNCSKASSGNIEERWTRLHNAIYNTAMDTLGKRERSNPDWFNTDIAELEPALTAERVALHRHKEEASAPILARLRKAWNYAKQLVRHCTNSYWFLLCQSIQQAADCGNIRGIYKGMKKSFSLCVIKVAP